MKSINFLASMVGAALCMGIAHSIICFTCDQKKSNWDCLRLSFCPKHSQKCLTIAVAYGIGNERLITKMCALDCPNLTHLSSYLYCCGYSWCNIWPPN